MNKIDTHHIKEWHFENQGKEDVLEDVLLAEEVDQENDLVIFNDDVNTFDFVIECLQRICDHHHVQAEQSAYIIHHTGKCAVLNGSFEKLRPRCEALLDKGLSASIE